MCGIFGSFHYKLPAPRAPLELIAHRGPDGRGEWRSPDGLIDLGHTRLAIIDLSPTGAQPMLDPQTGNVIVYNGEIYNHRGLREELAGHGIEWKGTSDTETILKAYAILGPEVVTRLKGMFAFLIYDARQQSIVAARDRFGIKPLYYVRHDQGVMFSSEVRPLTAFFNLAATPAGVSSYLSGGACPDQELLFPAVQSLPAGHYLILDHNGGVNQTRYWFPEQVPQADPVKRVRELLETAVQEHMLSDVPVATFLSGGIDSSIITAIAARNHPRRLRTFSVGFEEGAFDETANAAEVAKRFNTEHVRIELSEREVIGMVAEAVVRMDLPTVDAINTYVISKAVSDAGIKVALSGLGGDELFGGYPNFTDVPKLRMIAQLPPAWRRYAGRFLGPLGRRLATMPNTTDLAALAVWRRVFWTSDMLAAAGLPLREFPVERWTSDDFNQISWAEITHYMRHMLLRDSDQMSMAVGLELRVPFLDHHLVEYVLSLPGKEKTRRGGTKGLLVEACRDLISPAIISRPKRGFELPMDLWMRGPLREFVEAGIEKLSAEAVVSQAAIAAARDAFLKRRQHWTRYWALVVLGHYLARNHAARGAPDSPITHNANK